MLGSWTATARRGLMVIAGLIGAALLVGGCASAVAGSAEPVAGASAPGLPGTAAGGSTSGVITGLITTGLSLPVSRPPTTSGPPVDDSTVPESGGAGDVTTSVSTRDGTVTMTKGTPAVIVDIFAEPICPPCASFQLRFAPRLTTAVGQGKLAVRMHLMTFLDTSSASGDYSSRVVGALLCTAARSPDPEAFARLEEIVFSAAFQPAERGTVDRTDAEISAAGRKADVGQSALDCFGSSETKALTQLSNTTGLALLSAAGANVTPAVLEDGKPLDWQNDWLSPLLGG